MEKTFTKLSNLINDTIKIDSVGDYVFKKWNPQTSKMEVSQSYVEGYRKLYPVSTDKGQLDLGSGQLGSLLEAIQVNGSANLIGKTFAIKSNGKMGMDVRYFFNPVRDEVKTESTDDMWPENG